MGIKDKVRAVRSMAQKRAPLTFGDMQPASVVPAVRAYLSDSLEIVSSAFSKRAAKAEEQSRPLQCRVGCSSCCLDFAMVSAPEFAVLADAFDSLSEDDRARVVSSNEAWMDAHAGLSEEFVYVFDSEDQYMAFSDLVPSQEFIGATTARSWQKKTPCSFLSNRSECMVYDSRPSACRGHNSVDARGPSVCEDVLHAKDEKLLLRFDMADAVVAVLSDFRKRGLPLFPMGELNSLLARHIERRREHG